MNISLIKPLAIFDIEATGLDISNDRIVEIAILKVDPDGTQTKFLKRINPEIPIQPFVQQLTGINNKMLVNAPKFYQIAKRVLEITDNSILVAHNSSFDYRMLKVEFVVDYMHQI